MDIAAQCLGDAHSAINVNRSLDVWTTMLQKSCMRLLEFVALSSVKSELTRDAKICQISSCTLQFATSLERNLCMGRGVASLHPQRPNDWANMGCLFRSWKILKIPRNFQQNENLPSKEKVHLSTVNLFCHSMMSRAVHLLYASRAYMRVFATIAYIHKHPWYVLFLKTQCHLQKLE
jgi:hypothetical protein